MRPIVAFSKETGKHHLDLNARWIYEFDSRKRAQGNMLMVNATLKF